MADEVVDRYCSLADQFGARATASDDAWSKPAPCEGWTARDIVDHVTGSQRNVAKSITGEEPSVDLAGDPKQVWRDSYAAMKAALAQPGALDKVAPGPMGEMPVSMIVGRFLATDVLVHTWDLSRAIGADEQLDADAVKQAYSGLKPMDAMIRQPGVFGARIDPAPGDDEQTEFLKFLGHAV